jgi:hypothetical protein
MLTDRELQSLRNMGGESEDAANEIDALRAEVADLKELLNREFGARWEDWDAATLRHVSRERDALRAQVEEWQKTRRDAAALIAELWSNLQAR